MHAEIRILPRILPLSASGYATIGWFRLVGSLKLQVSFAEYSLFCRAILQKETYDFKEPTNRSQPISVCMCERVCERYICDVRGYTEPLTTSGYTLIYIYV